MPNYQETQVSGTKWQRCNQVVLNNPYNGQRTIDIREETIVNLDSTVFAQTVSGMKFDFVPDEIIQLRDPATGNATGASTSMQDIYVAIWSLYMQKAGERDNSVNQPVV